MTGAASPGATPLDPDEIEGLIPPGIATQGQLNLWESENILEAEAWVAGLRRLDVLEEAFVRELHARMFDRTWRWAGAYRKSEKNIGIAPEKIAPAILDLVRDARAQVEGRSLPIDEIAIRFHHRLTRIHPFANGNGRHARMITDLLLWQHGAKPFTWGRGDLVRAGNVRDAYIAALHAADGGNYAPLLAFARRSP